VAEPNGNLVVYNSSHQPVWSSNTAGQGVAPYSWAMKDNGNLVLTDSTNRTLWSSKTAGQGTPPFHFIIQSDCNGCIYGAGEQGGQAQWCTWTQGK
jgi:hypothetical protein